VLDDLIDSMQARKTEFAGQVRTVPISPEHPLELLEFDEIGGAPRGADDSCGRRSPPPVIAVTG
jgi:S-DNA-T family DNA segregation ATPase FtsK/SpoIIIE